jgi:hypothetical protein
MQKNLKYDAIVIADASPSKEDAFAITLTDLSLRESPEDPDKAFPPKKKAKGKVKGGTKFVYDKLAVVGNVNTPAEGYVRAIWYHIPAGAGLDEGWVVANYQTPANTGKVSNLVGAGHDGELSWAAIKAAKETPGKPKSDNTPTVEPPNEPQSDTAGLNPLIVVAIAVGLYLLTKKGN